MSQRFLFCGLILLFVIGAVPIPMHAKVVSADIIRLLRVNDVLPIALEETMHERRDSRPLIQGAKGFVKEGDVCPATTTRKDASSLVPFCVYEAGSMPRFTEYAYTVSQRAASSTQNPALIDGEGTIAVTTYKTNERTVVYPRVMPMHYGLAVTHSSSSELIAQAKSFNRPYRFSWKVIGEVGYTNIQELPQAFWRLAEQEDPDLPQRLIGTWIQELPIDGLTNRNTGTEYPVDLRLTVQSLKQKLVASPAYEIDPASIREQRDTSGMRLIQFGLRIKSSFVETELRRRVQEIGGDAKVSSTRKRELRAALEHEKGQLNVTKMLFEIDERGRLLRSEARRTFDDRLPIGCMRDVNTKKDVCKNTMVRKVSQTGITRFRYEAQGPIQPPATWVSSEDFADHDHGHGGDDGR